MSAWFFILMLLGAHRDPVVVSMPWSLSFDKGMPTVLRTMEKSYLQVLGRIAKLQPQSEIVNFLARKENLPFRLCREDSVCWTDLMSKLKADAIVRNEITGLGGQYFLYVQVYTKDARGKLQNSGAFTIALKKGWLSRVEEKLTRILVPWKFVGRLLIESDVRGARVVVDGAPVCATPCGAITVPAGVHAVRITHELYRDYVRFIEVKYHSAVKIQANLTAYPKVTGRLRAQTIKHKPVSPKQRTGAVGPSTSRRPWYATGWGRAAIIAASFAVSLAAGYMMAPDEVIYPPYDLHIDIK